jgi:hypothetical protein
MSASGRGKASAKGGQATVSRVFLLWILSGNSKKIPPLSAPPLIRGARGDRHCGSQKSRSATAVCNMRPTIAFIIITEFGMFPIFYFYKSIFPCIIIKNFQGGVMKKISILVTFFTIIMCGISSGAFEDKYTGLPNDPSFCCESNCPNYRTDCNIYDEQWNLFSFTPESILKTGKLRPDEVGKPSGISADEAWKINAGRWDVTIAVLDSGFRWEASDLVNKWRLNRAELPPLKIAPECSGTDYKNLPLSCYDINGDGIFNMQDYIDPTKCDIIANPHCQPNISDIDLTIPGMSGFTEYYVNGILDPGDLIHWFSDGIDNDNNGYIDDICGWDFLYNDNDAFDTETGGLDYSHGNGEAHDSAAEGNNGMGEIGVCPGCSLLPLRAGDSFVVDINGFAMAALYAVENGASVIQEALGSINNTPFAKDVVDYAWKNNVSVIASAADELSYHHNYPGNYNHTVYVHAIAPDSLDGDAANTTTFLNFNNCTNFGGHLVLSTPGTGCSSEATGKTSGIAGLVYSRAKELGISLTANEVKQILTLSADDIYVPESATDPTKFPSKPGWERYFGYGRANALKAVQMVSTITIPPEADIELPQWFETLYPENTPVVEIKGYAHARRAGSFNVILEYAVGLESKDADFIEIKTFTNQNSPIDGTIAQWDLTQVQMEYAKIPERAEEDLAVTLRLRVIDNEHSGVYGEDRKTVFIHRDPDLHPGFPKFMNASGESSPSLADMDRDGVFEIVFATADGLVHVLNSEGNELPGWPQSVEFMMEFDPNNNANHLNSPAISAGEVKNDYRASIDASVAVGDLDGDGTPEVIAASMEGKLFAWHADGTILDGFPVSSSGVLWQDDPGVYGQKKLVTGPDPGFFSTPALADIDNDGKLEIIAPAMDQYLYVFRYDGSIQSGFPVLLRDTTQTAPVAERIISSPAVGDIDGDGLTEIVVGTSEVYGSNGRVYAVRADGSFVNGWPIEALGLMADILPYVGRGVPTNPALADVDGDGVVDIAINSILAPTLQFVNWLGIPVKLLNNSDFAINSKATDAPTFPVETSGSFGYIDENDSIDYVLGTVGISMASAFAAGGKRAYYEHHLSAWDTGSGLFLDGFPVVVEDLQFFMNPAIADITGDGKAEIISGSGGYMLHAVNYKGEEAQGWPKFTGGWLIPSPAVGDIDGDGRLEVVTISREGWLYVWDTPGTASADGRSRVQWQEFKHDPMKTSNFTTQLIVQKGASEEKGCGCNATTGKQNGLQEVIFFVLTFIIFLRTYRNRRRAKI